MMAETLDEMIRPQRDGVEPRIRLTGDGKRGWILSQPGNPTRRFGDFATALDTARRGPGTHDAAIEVWQHGEYICCLLSGRSYCSPAPPLGRVMPQGRVMARVERYANRVAEVLLITSGPLFWTILVLFVLAASLGWRLTLL